MLSNSMSYLTSLQPIVEIIFVLETLLLMVLLLCLCLLLLIPLKSSFLTVHPVNVDVPRFPQMAILFRLPVLWNFPSDLVHSSTTHSQTIPKSIPPPKLSCGFIHPLVTLCCRSPLLKTIQMHPQHHFLGS